MIMYLKEAKYYIKYLIIYFILWITITHFYINPLRYLPEIFRGKVDKFICFGN